MQTCVLDRREATGMGGRECLLSEARFENCTLTGCEFTGCTFRRTTFRGLKLAGITLRNVDFTGLTIETEEEFRRLCETGDKTACVRFGMALEKNRSHQATWRKAHADWFFWEH